MSTTAVTPPPGYTIDPSDVQVGSQSTGNIDPSDVTPDPTANLPAGYTIEKPGEQQNDVGATVVVPKDGESFQDTVKRAVNRGKQNPQAVQADIAKEMTPRNVATKTAQTLGAAATIGVAGPAALAGAGEVGSIINQGLVHTTNGVKAIGAWAAQKPMQAYILYQVLKELVPGAKKMIGIAEGAPDVK